MYEIQLASYYLPKCGNVNFQAISHKPFIQRNYIPVASAKDVFEKKHQYHKHVHVFLKMYTMSNEQCLQSRVTD